MYPISLLNKTENKYPVEIIVAKDLPVWEFLRNIYSDRLFKAQCHYIEDKNHYSPKLIIDALYNYYWMNQNRNKNFPAILFTDALEERVIDGLIQDKTSHNLLTLLQNKSLVVLDPIINKHKQYSKYFHTDMLSIFSFILPTKFKFENVKIENIQYLNKIESTIGLKIPHKKIVNHFFVYVNIFQSWIQKNQPKIIFINCYYSLRHQALIYAAKQNNIITVEFQHGLISKNQTAYSPTKDLGKHTFPDYLLSFGEIEKKQISINFINSEKIIPIGSYYLEYMMEQNITQQYKDMETSLRKTFDKIILISSQNLIEEKLINFLSKVAKKLPQFIFLLVPRRTLQMNKYSSLPGNLLIKPQLNLYQFCCLCDIHSTVFSTFASESSFMGTPNIFINIDNLSELFYSNIFLNHLGVKFADDDESYVKIITNWIPPKKPEIKKMSQNLFVNNNHDRIKQFLKQTISL